MNPQERTQILEYYRKLGAPSDQQMLIALLRDVQQEDGGCILHESLEAIRQHYDLSPALLPALISRIPGLRAANVPHRLELCDGTNCIRRQTDALLDWLERTYDVKPGGTSCGNVFILKLCPCMRQCGKGPNIKWDGRLYSGATTQLLQRLIESKP